ncbi:MAG TPA: hypothetical protein VHU83_16780 [Bryobacteraceae bacterium]|nr:hypothetical protein [Bryobacteraceae bacterium]
MNAASVDFLHTEADTGLLFANIAMGSDEFEKTARNQAHARLAYDTVLRFVGRVSLTAAEAEGLSAKMGRLKGELRMLGESF